MAKVRNAISENLRAIARDRLQQVAAAAYAEMSIEATEMKRRTPVDTTENAPHPGNLRNSIHVEEPVISGNTVSVIVATGAQAPYDIYVHENPDAEHPIGEWKFMESVLDESAPYILDRIGNRVKF